MRAPRSVPLYRIDPFDLRLFAAIVEQGSITAGAGHIHLSLAAASTRLQRLEHALGAPVLLRSRRGVALTDAGRTLLRHAGRLASDLEALQADMAAHAHGLRSTVRVLCNTAAMTEHLPALLGSFLGRFPSIDVELQELASQDALFAMRQQRADIGVVADHVVTDGLTTLPFREDRLVALLPAGSPRVPAGSRLTFAELLEQPFVGLPAESGLSRFLQSRALAHGRGLHHRVRLQSLEAVVRLVAQGVGVAVVPEAAARRLADPACQAIPLEDAWARRQLLLCVPAGIELGSGAQTLLDFMAASARQAPR